MTGTISHQEFETLRDFIYSVCGIFFQAGKKYFLESRIERRMEDTGARTTADYLALLKHPVRGKDELKMLLNEITTNETCFFRNTSQLTALEQLLLPEVIAAKENIGFRKLRIWSAGSSSGEEAYTLAMLVCEKFPALLAKWTIEIVGTDISEKVVAQAKTGTYSHYSVRNTPGHYLKKYFTPVAGGMFALAPEVKNLVTFSSLNLYDDSRMIFMKHFDFIFCANVLIYFDTSSKRKVVQHFYNNLQPYGYFFVGQAESLHGVNDQFKVVHFPGGFGYRK